MAGKDPATDACAGNHRQAEGGEGEGGCATGQIVPVHIHQPARGIAQGCAVGLHLHSRAAGQGRAVEECDLARIFGEMQPKVEGLARRRGAEDVFGHSCRVQGRAEGEDRLPCHGHAVFAILRAAPQQTRATDSQLAGQVDRTCLGWAGQMEIVAARRGVALDKAVAGAEGDSEIHAVVAHPTDRPRAAAVAAHDSGQIEGRPRRAGQAAAQGDCDAAAVLPGDVCGAKDAEAGRAEAVAADSNVLGGGGHGLVCGGQGNGEGAFRYACTGGCLGNGQAADEHSQAEQQGEQMAKGVGLHWDSPWR